MTAEAFIAALQPHITEGEKAKLERFYKGDDANTRALGVRFGTVFKLAKEYSAMPVAEIEKLLEDDHYEMRIGAMRIMDYQVQRKATSEDQRRALYELYLRRHDRIDNWDFVDAAAARVVGDYLADKPRQPLYELARSDNRWERRTSMVATHAFIKQGEVDDALAIAGILIDDPDELVNKAVGTFLREVGKVDPDRLKCFLDRCATTMPRVTLRYAVEKLDPETKRGYMEMGR